MAHQVRVSPSPLGDIGRTLTTPLRELVRLWRRSIQARVVIGTLTLSAVLAILAGWVLLRQVSDGLVESKRKAVLAQASAGIDTAQSQLEAPDAGNVFESGTALNQLLDLLSPRSRLVTTTTS